MRLINVKCICIELFTIHIDLKQLYRKSDCYVYNVCCTTELDLKLGDNNDNNNNI